MGEGREEGEGHHIPGRGVCTGPVLGLHFSGSLGGSGGVRQEIRLEL